MDYKELKALFTPPDALGSSRLATSTSTRTTSTSSATASFIASTSFGT